MAIQTQLTYAYRNPNALPQAKQLEVYAVLEALRQDYNENVPILTGDELAAFMELWYARSFALGSAIADLRQEWKTDGGNGWQGVKLGQRFEEAV